jgi:hypothetical protein
MICAGKFLKNSFVFVISVAKPKNFVVFSFTYVSRSPALFNGNFCMNLFSIDSDEAMSDEAMKRGDEAFNGSSLQFLRIVKRFIVVNS